MAKSVDPAAELREAQDRIVAVWGQMGSAWGISRTQAEVHSLLYIVGEPMSAEEIMERLQISRGNASMSVRALLEWGVISRTHKRGDRREYYYAEADVWSMFRAILRERMKREVEPLLAALFEIRDETEPRTRRDLPEDVISHNKRLDELLDVLSTIEKLSQSFISPSGRGLRVAATMLSKVS
ncbi:MAG: GbsR/MarR family transcriptional regulator [Phycisphaerales bacterium JB039]